ADEPAADADAPAFDEDAPAEEAAAAPAEPENPLLPEIEKSVLPWAKKIRAALREAEAIVEKDAERSGFEEIKPDMAMRKLDAGLKERKDALAGRTADLETLKKLVDEATKALVELQKGAVRVENAAKPILRAKERAAKEEAERRAAEAAEAAAKAEEERKAAEDRAEIDQVQEYAHRQWPLLTSHRYAEFQERVRRLGPELKTEAGKAELEWTCRRAQALDDLRKWVIKDLKDNGTLQRGYRRNFDITGVSPDGKSILLRGAPEVPVDKLKLADWVTLYRMLLADRPATRRGVTTIVRGTQLLNAAVYCYVFGQDESGTLDERALETCRLFADKALQLRSGLEEDVPRLVPPLAGPRPSDDETIGDSFD
ncbi:MAG: hypothetical protein IJ783_08320, partial [Kiritimatiellae bacterium]|nr:hypothetical protein [Kiritimatiellia bacterium]